MTYRTDVQIKDGKLAVRESADNTKPLPDVDLSDRLASDKWGGSFEKALQPHGLENDGAIQGAIRAQKSMVEGVKRLMTMRENQHPNDRQSVHLEKVAKEYGAFQKSYIANFGRARDTIKARMGEVATEFESTLKFDMSEAPSIHRALANMKPEERREAISTQIARGDGRGLATILKSNPLSVGISFEEQETYRKQAMHQHRPDLLALERELQRADDLVFNTFNDVLSIEDQLTAKSVRDHYAGLAQKADESRQPQWG